MGGAATPVQRLITLFACCDHAEMLMQRETSPAGAKRYGCGVDAVSYSRSARYARRCGTIIGETDVTVGPLPT